MEYTENYNLEKQQEEDFIDINGINANFDTIDTTMKEIADAVAGKAAASHNHDGTYAATNHNHSGLYATLQDLEDLTASDVGAAPEDHNHAGVYSSVNHNHDSAYAAANHNHSGVYAPVSHSHNYAGSSTPGGAATTALACTGNAATATKATEDGNGNNIADTYAPKASPAFTGTPTVAANTAYTTAIIRNINVVAKANSPVNGAASSLPNGTITFVKKA